MKISSQLDLVEEYRTEAVKLLERLHQSKKLPGKAFATIGLPLTQLQLLIDEVRAEKSPELTQHELSMQFNSIERINHHWKAETGREAFLISRLRLTHEALRTCVDWINEQYKQYREEAS